MVLAVLFIVLFPIWPYELKYAIWLISLYLLIFLLSLIAIRLAIFILCCSVGLSVWIFPNLLGDYGVLESFKPIFYVERWDYSKINILLRLLALTVIVVEALI